MAASKFTCPKCHKGTSKKFLTEHGMCGSCRKIWFRESFDQTLNSIPIEVEAMVKKAIEETSTLALAASRMKKEYKLAWPQREWDMVMLVLVDERRRSRT